MRASENPYLVGSPVQNKESFYGRQDAFHWVTTELNNPAIKLLLLHGRRQVGKSSFLYYLEHALPEDAFLTVYFALRQQPLDSLTTDLADTIIAKLDSDITLPETFDNLGYAFQKEFLPQIWDALDGRHLALLFDDAANIPTDHSFWRLIEQLTATSPGLGAGSIPATFIFTTSQHPLTFSTEQTRLFKTGLTRELWTLGQEAARALICRGTETGKLAFTMEALTHLLDLAGHHPHLLQLLGHQLWLTAEQQDEPLKVQVEDVAQVIPEVLATAVTSFAYLWGEFDIAEQLYAATIADLITPTETLSETDLRQKVINAQAMRLRPYKLSYTHTELQQRHLLTVAANKGYRLALPLFHYWIAQNKSLSHLKEEMEQANPLAENLFQVGQQYLLIDEPKDAAHFFHRAVNHNPFHVGAQVYLGTTLLQLGHLESAIKRLQKAYTLDEDEARYPFVEALLIQGDKHIQVEDRNAALIIAQHAATIAPDDEAIRERIRGIETAVWNQRGDLALARGNIDKALQAYQSAGNAEKITQIETAQKREELARLENEAHTFVQAEEWQQALEIYEKILGLAPNPESRQTAEKTLTQCMEEVELAQYFDDGVRAIEAQNWLLARMSLMHVITKQMNYARHGRRALELLDQVARRHAFTSMLTPPAIAAHVPKTSLAISNHTTEHIDELERLGKGAIKQIAYAPDGTKIALATGIGIYLYHTHTLDEILFIATNTPVTAITFSPDGTIIASVAKDYIIRLWWVEDGKLLGQLEGHKNAIETAVFAPHGNLLASGDTNGELILWRIDTSNQIHSWAAHPQAVTAAAFSPDATLLLTGSRDKTAVIWQLENYEALITIKKHQEALTDVAFSPDGQFVATASRDKTARIWRLDELAAWRKLTRQTRKASLVHTLPAHRQSVNSITYSPDGRLLATAASDNSVRLWQTSDGTLLHEFLGHSSPVISATFSANGQILASASEGRVRFWHVLDRSPGRTIDGHIGALNHVAISPDGAMLATAVAHHILLWHMGNSKPEHTLSGHTGRIYTAAFSPDGTRLVTAAADHTVRLWSVIEAASIRTLIGHDGPVLGVAFSPDGQTIASASSDHTIRLWRVESGELLQTLNGHEGAVASVTFSSDGKILASSSGDHTVRLWSLPDGNLRHMMNGHQELVWQVCFSADDTLIASASRDHHIHVWRAENGELLHKLENGDGPVWSVQFSPDSELLVSGANDNKVRLWCMGDGRLLQTLDGHTAPVSRVLFTPDGEKLISASSDGTIRMHGLNSKN